MLNKDCEYFGGGHCLCDVCQSMRKTLEELANLKTEDILEKAEAKTLYAEMKAALEETKHQNC